LLIFAIAELAILSHPLRIIAMTTRGEMQVFTHAIQLKAVLQKQPPVHASKTFPMQENLVLNSYKPLFSHISI